MKGSRKWHKFLLCICWYSIKFVKIGQADQAGQSSKQIDFNK